jgi:uncharacterized protein (TIGR02246 family)
MRKSSGSVLVLVLLTVAVFPLVSHVSPTTAVVSANNGRESQIERASEAWDEAFNAADVRKLMSLYADDAVSMPPGFETLVGKDAIRADFEWFFDNFYSYHQTTIVDIVMSGRLAVEQGDYFQTFTPKNGGDPFMETGKHIVVYRKSGRSWKVVKEIWNQTP